VLKSPSAPGELRRHFRVLAKRNQHPPGIRLLLWVRSALKRMAIVFVASMGSVFMLPMAPELGVVSLTAIAFSLASIAVLCVTYVLVVFFAYTRYSLSVLLGVVVGLGVAMTLLATGNQPACVFGVCVIVSILAWVVGGTMTFDPLSRNKQIVKEQAQDNA